VYEAQIIIADVQLSRLDVQLLRHQSTKNFASLFMGEAWGRLHFVFFGNCR